MRCLFSASSDLISERSFSASAVLAADALLFGCGSAVRHMKPPGRMALGLLPSAEIEEELLAVAPELGVMMQVITDEESLSLEIEAASLSSTALSAGSGGLVSLAAEDHRANFERVAKKSAAPSEGTEGEEERVVF